MGIKERRTKILLALILLSDVNLDPIPFDAKLQKIFDLSFNQKTRGTISAMLKEGLIEKNSDSKSADVIVSQPGQENPSVQNVNLTSDNVYRLT